MSSSRNGSASEARINRNERRKQPEAGGERGNEHVPCLALDVGVRRNESMSARGGGGGGGGEASPAGLSPLGSFPRQQSRIHTGRRQYERHVGEGEHRAGRSAGLRRMMHANREIVRRQKREKLGMRDNRMKDDAHRATTYVFILLRVGLRFPSFSVCFFMMTMIIIIRNEG